MIALLVVAGIIIFLFAVPSSQPTTIITVNKTTHVHVHVDVKVLSLPPPSELDVQTEPLQTLMSQSTPAGTALERYRAPQFQVTERKLLA